MDAVNRKSANPIRIESRWMVLIAAALLCQACGGGSAVADNKPPIASAKIDGEAVLQAVTRFDTTGSSDADGSIASKQWEYGDGSTGTGDSHSYTAVGTYSARLTVTDNQGAQSQSTVSVTVAKCSADGLSLAAISPQHSVVCMQTTLGELVLELFPAQAPITVGNFLKYVDDGFYVGTLVHRVIAGFVAQGGGFTSGMVAKQAAYSPIALESNNGLSNSIYTLAMARTSVPASATSQFFVNLVDNSACLNRGTFTCDATGNGYAVFGQLLATTSRQAIVDAIAGVATTTVGGNANVPVTEIVVRSAVRVP